MIDEKEILAAHRKAIEILRRQLSLYQNFGEATYISKLLDGYLEKLRRMSAGDVADLIKSAPPVKRRLKRRPAIDLESLSLAEIAEILKDESVPRLILERIAIEYFHVPKGSMRSFKNLESLREKIFTLVNNEFARLDVGVIANKTRV